MNTENRIHCMKLSLDIYNTIIKVASRRELDASEIRDEIVLKLMFEADFVRSEIQIEKSTYYPDRDFDLRDIDQAREFLQHVMERHGAAPFDFTDESFQPLSVWIPRQLLLYCLKHKKLMERIRAMD